MASFRGSFRHSIDAKGRLALPKAFRRVIGDGRDDGRRPRLILTRGFNGCISVYAEDDWPTYERRLRDMPLEDQGSRDLALAIAKWTRDVDVDGAGRVNIPELHMRLGGLEKNQEVLVLGMFDHVELWNIQRYEERVAGPEADFEQKAMEFFRRHRQQGQGTSGSE